MIRTDEYPTSSLSRMDGEFRSLPVWLKALFLATYGGAVLGFGAAVATSWIDFVPRSQEGAANVGLVALAVVALALLPPIHRLSRLVSPSCYWFFVFLLVATVGIVGPMHVELSEVRTGVRTAIAENERAFMDLGRVLGTDCDQSDHRYVQCPLPRSEGAAP